MAAFLQCALLVSTAVLSFAAQIEYVPAPAPALSPKAEALCAACVATVHSGPRSVSLDIIVATDVAQFYSYTAEGSVLVYFAARATFSHTPGSLNETDIIVEGGSVLELMPANECTEFLLKGVVRQEEAWITNLTDINIAIAYGSVKDCTGVPFPAALDSFTHGNGPVGSMYVPDMAYTAEGPITNSAFNILRIAFSQPVVGLDIAAFNVSLTPAATASATAPPPSAIAPAPLPACLPAYRIIAIPAVANSTQFYDLKLTLPECFFGLVLVEFTGTVTNEHGANSVPVKPVGFNRVEATIPVSPLTAYEMLPPLVMDLNDTCI